MVMDMYYTRHAEYQIKERKIEKVWIEETIKAPDKTEKEGNKFYVVKKLNGRTLKVVYVKERYIKVVTMFWL